MIFRFTNIRNSINKHGGSFSGAIPDGKIPRDVFLFVLAGSLCNITYSQELPMLFYKFINNQTLTLNLNVKKIKY